MLFTQARPRCVSSSVPLHYVHVQAGFKLQQSHSSLTASALKKVPCSSVGLQCNRFLCCLLVVSICRFCYRSNLISGYFLFKVVQLDFLREYLSSLSIYFVTMSKDMGKRLPQLYYIKMTISYDLEGSF